MTGQGNGNDVCREAASLVRAGRFEEAIDLFRKRLEQDDDSIEAHRGLATACFMAGRYEDAAEHFSRVMRLDPREGKTLVNLGAVYNRMKQYDKAVEVLRRGAQMEKCPEAFYNLGIAQRHLGQAAMAVSAYREAIRLRPNMVEAYQNLGNVYMEMGNHRQAIAQYKQALEICPEFTRAQVGIAAAEQAIQKSRQSISPFGRLVGESSTTESEKHPTRVNRVRDSQEQAEHQVHLQQLSVVIRDTSRTLAIHLKEQIEPRLQGLSREIGKGSEGAHQLGKILGRFQEAVERWTQLRSELETAMSDLRESD